MAGNTPEPSGNDATSSQNFGDQNLAQEIDRYAEYFKTVKSELPPPQWKSPMEAVEAAFDKPWEGSPKWGSLDKEAFRPSIEEWLKQNRITDLSQVAHGYNGWTAACFEAQLEGASASQLVRIGSESDHMPHLARLWNPFLLQPDAQSIFIRQQGGEDYKLSIERVEMPLAMVPPREPAGFDDFLNRHILVGTPYKMKDHKDLSVLRDGTPIYGDPDSIGFASAELAERHVKDQWDPAWQQKIMQTVHANSERLNLPQSMRWVEETSPGFFATKRSPDPLPLGPHWRSVVWLRPSTEDPAFEPQAQHVPGPRGESRPSLRSIAPQPVSKSTTSKTRARAQPDTSLEPST